MEKATVSWTVQTEFEGASTTAVYDPAPEPRGDSVIVFGHGASAGKDHATIVNLTTELRARGIHTVRFNFLYMEAKKGPPDRMPKLTATFAAVLQSVREKFAPSRLLAGGHSMGGRTASMLAAEGGDIEGLILCAYPLHPGGQPEKLRDEHLPRIPVPTLCFNGTRDELCTKAIMEEVLKRLPETFTMHWLEGADHGFHVQKKSGRTDMEVLTEFGQVSQTWIKTALASHSGA